MPPFAKWLSTGIVPPEVRYIPLCKSVWRLAARRGSARLHNKKVEGDLVVKGINKKKDQDIEGREQEKDQQNKVQMKILY